MKKTECITVYCASSVSVDDIYFEAARQLGIEIARRGVTLVTGAGSMGLMGEINNAAISAGGHTVGVIPGFMVERGWNHDSLGELIVTDSMHTRKEKMAAMADGVIALPGGIGTFEELLEIITWRQLGLYNGNIVIFNVDGYYDELLKMLEKAIEKKFMKPDHKEIWTVATNANEAVNAALAYNGTNIFSAKF